MNDLFFSVVHGMVVTKQRRQDAMNLDEQKLQNLKGFTEDSKIRQALLISRLSAFSTVNDGDKPANDGGNPASDGEKPASDGKEIACDGKEPGCDGQKPPSDGNKPPRDGNKPACDGKKPACVGKPAIDGKDGKKPNIAFLAMHLPETRSVADEQYSSPDDLLLEKRFGGYDRNNAFNRWIARRYGYFDTLASSIIKK